MLGAPLCLPGFLGRMPWLGPSLPCRRTLCGFPRPDSEVLTGWPQLHVKVPAHISRGRKASGHLCMETFASMGIPGAKGCQKLSYEPALPSQQPHGQLSPTPAVVPDA